MEPSRFAVGGRFRGAVAGFFFLLSSFILTDDSRNSRTVCMASVCVFTGIGINK